MFYCKFQKEQRGPVTFYGTSASCSLLYNSSGYWQRVNSHPDLFLSSLRKGSSFRPSALCVAIKLLIDTFICQVFLVTLSHIPKASHFLCLFYLCGYLNHTGEAYQGWNNCPWLLMPRLKLDLVDFMRNARYQVGILPYVWLIAYVPSQMNLWGILTIHVYIVYN